MSLLQRLNAARRGPRHGSVLSWPVRGLVRSHLAAACAATNRGMVATVERFFQHDPWRASALAGQQASSRARALGRPARALGGPELTR